MKNHYFLIVAILLFIACDKNDKRPFLSNIAELGDRKYVTIFAFQDRVYLAGGYTENQKGVYEYNDLWETEDFIIWKMKNNKLFDINSYYLTTEKLGEDLILFQIGNQTINDKYIRFIKNGDIEKVSNRDIFELVRKNKYQFYFLNFDSKNRYGFTNPFLFSNNSSEIFLLEPSDGIYKLDGMEFKIQKNSDECFGFKIHPIIVEHKSMIFVLSGKTHEAKQLDYDSYTNDVWASYDPISKDSWKQLAKVYVENLPSRLEGFEKDIYKTFPPREYGIGVSFKGKIYIMGGFRRLVDKIDGMAKEYWYKDVWASPDGVEWEQIVGPKYNENYLPEGWETELFPEYD